MAATTLDRNTLKRGPIRQQVLPVKTGVRIPIGVMVMVNIPSTGADNAADTATTQVIGVSCQAVDQTLGDSKIAVEKCIAQWANGGHITAAHVGIVACVVDNQTVDLAANTTNAIGAGYIDSVDGNGVFVDMTGPKVNAA
jgi:hypothetical protein